MPALSLQKTVFILLFLFLVGVGLHYTKPFLVPLAFACLITMLLIPLSAKLESKGLNKALAALICVLLVLIFVAGILSLVVWQVTDMAADADQIAQQFQIQGVPTLILFKSGQIKWRQSGVVPVNALVSVLTEHSQS